MACPNKIPNPYIYSRLLSVKVGIKDITRYIAELDIIANNNLATVTFVTIWAIFVLLSLFNEISFVAE
ncbi:hypothetical protein SD074_15370 [Prolixibacter sp. SD074]|nr:hypothetical protein SD074_15370 [Prolixibacter sp. SD074]